MRENVGPFHTLQRTRQNIFAHKVKTILHIAIHDRYIVPVFSFPFLHTEVKIMNAQNIADLFFSETLRDQPAHQLLAYRDLFAIGCYLRTIGREEAGQKACINALRAVGCKEMKKACDYLSEHEQECFQAVHPHAEIASLMPPKAPAAK